MIHTDKVQTGRNLNDIRKARKMTLKKLADKSGTTIATVQRHIKYGVGRVDYLLRYSESLGCDPSDILKGSADLEKYTLEDDITNIYPFNLAFEVVMPTGVHSAEVKRKHRNDVHKVYIPAFLEQLETLTEREQSILDLRYRNGLTLEQTGYLFNITRERVRQVEAKAIRKLRNPVRSKKWYKDTIDKAIDIEFQRARLERENDELKKKLGIFESVAEKNMFVPFKSVPIDEMDLSVRSYNCLKRAGIKTTNDLSKIDEVKLRHIRNLGKRSIEEIIEKAKGFGINIPYCMEKKA